MIRQCFLDLIGGHFQCVAVQPHQIRSFRLHRFDLRRVPSKIMNDKLCIFCQIRILLVHPTHHHRCSRPRLRVRQAVRAHKPCFPKRCLLSLFIFRIRNDAAGRVQTGHIKSLADRSINDHPVIYVCKAGCRSILIAVEGHITVDLIGEQPYRIFSAQHDHPFHLIPRPDTSDRVMGIAEYHGFYPTCQLLFEIFPVNAVASILIDQRTVLPLFAPGCGFATKNGSYTGVKTST